MSSEKYKSPEAILGYRSWQIDLETFELSSSTDFDTKWNPGSNTAFCRRSPGSVTENPSSQVLHSDNCHCGFNAFYEFSEIEFGGYTGPHTITGSIAGAGKCALHETGFRSEKAQVIALLAPVDNVLFRAIAEKYDVPLFIDLEEFISFSEQHASTPSKIRKSLSDDIEKDIMSATIPVSKNSMKEKRDLRVTFWTIIAGLAFFSIFHFMTVKLYGSLWDWKLDSIDEIGWSAGFVLEAILCSVLVSGVTRSLISKDRDSNWGRAETIVGITVAIIATYAMVLFVSDFDKDSASIRKAHSQIVAKTTAIESFYATHGFYPKQIPDVKLNDKKVRLHSSRLRSTKDSYKLTTVLPTENKVFVEGKRGLQITATCSNNKDAACNDDIYDFSSSLPFIDSIDSTDKAGDSGETKDCSLNYEKTFSVDAEEDVPKIWNPQFDCENN